MKTLINGIRRNILPIESDVLALKAAAATADLANREGVPSRASLSQLRGSGAPRVSQPFGQ